MSDAGIELILCDVGGVLGSNGWDTGERARTATHFGLELAPFERRHAEAVATFECGRMTLAEYLDFSVFNEKRDFTRDAFREFMFAQSVPNHGAIDLMSGIAATRRWRMMTLNNESAELNDFRVQLFGLRPIFSAFLTSAYVGAQKPHESFYERTLAICHAIPDRTVFIDDRDENLAPARQRGIHCIHATDTGAVRDGLAALGIHV